MDVDYQKYKYYIFTPPFDEQPMIRGRIMPYWIKFWSGLLNNLGSEEGLCQDEFYWQDRITCITDGGTDDERIAAMQFIAGYPIQAFIHSDYNQRYLPQDLAQQYLAEGNGYINTLQYLSVDPAYQSGKTGINFGSVLMDISTLHHRDMQAMVSLTVARKSVGVHNLARKIGFSECASASKHGVDVSVMHSYKPQRHPKKSITKIADYFWKNRHLISSKENAA